MKYKGQKTGWDRFKKLKVTKVNFLSFAVKNRKS